MPQAYQQFWNRIERQRVANRDQKSRALRARRLRERNVTLCQRYTPARWIETFPYYGVPGVVVIGSMFASLGMSGDGAFYGVCAGSMLAGHGLKALKNTCRRYGTEKGGKIVRRFQLASFGMCVAAGLMHDRADPPSYGMFRTDIARPFWPERHGDHSQNMRLSGKIERFFQPLFPPQP